MRIRIQSDGGVGYFPGLAEPVSIDTARLSADERARLESMVGAAGFFGLSQRVGSPAPARPTSVNTRSRWTMAAARTRSR